LQKQVNEKHVEDIEKRMLSTIIEMGEIQQKIVDLNHILEKQKNLKLRHDTLKHELNQLRHPVLT